MGDAGPGGGYGGPARGRAHPKARHARVEPAHAALDACIDVSGVCSLCDSYVRLPVLQPLYERSQLKVRRVLPAGLFVAPLVFSSTGVFLESTLRPLLVRFAEALREEHPADDDDVLQEMSERRFMPQLSTAVQRGWVYPVSYTHLTLPTNREV